MEKGPMINYDKNIGDIPREHLVRLYKQMLRIRKVQVRIEEEYPKDEMKTPVHLCKGQEAIPAGMCAHLDKEDYLLSNYRGHGHYLAKGGDLKSLIAELYGRETGCSRGRGGSMHLIDNSVGLLGSSSIVAGGIPIATGAALGSLLQGNKRVTMVLFGDGAVDEGVLYESINFAMLKRLPVIYVCENNLYAVCSHRSNRQPSKDIYERFDGFGISRYKADGNNVVDVYRVGRRAVEDARRGKGPSFIEFCTYRWCGHSGGGTDIELGYRTQEELDAWMERCPLKNFELFLLDRQVISGSDITCFNQAFDKEIDEAFEFARNSPFPDEAEVSKYLYSDGE